MLLIPVLLGAVSRCASGGSDVGLVLWGWCCGVGGIDPADPLRSTVEGEHTATRCTQMDQNEQQTAMGAAGEDHSKNTHSMNESGETS